MANLPLDDSRNPITNFDNGFIVRSRINLGNVGATITTPFDIFTVTGVNLVKVFGNCTTDLAGASALLSVGMAGAGQTAFLIGELTGTAIDAGEIVAGEGATAVSGPGLVALAGSILTQNILADGLDIVGTVTTADLTGGVIDYYCLHLRYLQLG